MINDMRMAMTYYADMGLPVIPLCPADEESHSNTSPGHRKICRCSGKIPLIKNWSSHAETTEDDIALWNSQFKAYNIGLPMGSKSGYIGIDIDGSEGEDLLQEMSGGNIPETWEFLTGAGRRLLYQIPVGLNTKKVKQTGEGKHQECAILCDGQQTVLPPSMHFSGKAYFWKTGCNPEDIDCCMAPNWLINLVRQDTPTTFKITNRVSESPRYQVDMLNLADEFVQAALSTDIPSELLDLKDVEVKVQTSRKSSTKIKESEIEKILYQPIAEGNRDDTMTKIIGHFLSQGQNRRKPKEWFMQDMLEYNRRCCDPPLDDMAIRSKVDYFWEIEAQKTSMYKSSRSKKEWLIDDVVNMIYNKLEDDDILIKYDKSMHKFFYTSKTKGPWIKDEDEITEANIWSYLKSIDSGDQSWGHQHKLDEAIKALDLDMRKKGLSKKGLFDMNQHRTELSQYIVVGGQLLDWKNNTIVPWDPMYNATVNFDVEYDAEAKCPNWESYLKDWLPDESIRNLLQEFMGSCLLPEAAPEEKFIILAGSGSNGKSMFLDGMKNIFQKFAISMTPQKLSERFGPAALFGKLVNICSEIEGDGGYLKNTAQIKAIVSGEPLTAENKGQDPFEFSPVANLIFSCNSVPKVKDKSTGWYRRQLIIPFDKTFTPNSVIGRQMKDNMLAEKSGIFNWLIEGLRRIKERGYFIVSDELQQVQANFKAINDPMEGFIKDCITRKTDKEMLNIGGMQYQVNGLSTNIVMELYDCWCRYSYGDNHNYKKSPRNFNHEMEDKGYHKSRGYCLYQKKKTSIFSNMVIDITNPELYNVITVQCEGCAVSEPGFYLMDIVRKKRKEEQEENK